VKNRFSVSRCCCGPTDCILYSQDFVNNIDFFDFPNCFDELGDWDQRTGTWDTVGCMLTSDATANALIICESETIDTQVVKMWLYTGPLTTLKQVIVVIINIVHNYGDLF